MIIAAHETTDQHYRVTTTREDLRRIAVGIDSGSHPRLMRAISEALFHGRPLPVLEVDAQELQLLLAAVPS